MQNSNEYSLEKKEKSFILPETRNHKQSLIDSEEFKYKKNISSLVIGRKRWKDISNKDKLILIFGYIIDKSYYTLSLDLSKSFIKKISHLSRKEQIDFIRRRVNINLKNNFGYLPNSILLVAYEKDREIHLHGVIKINYNEINKLKRILKKTFFGKDYKETSFNRYIVDIKQVYAPKSWLRYITKDFANNSKKVFNEFYICRALIKEAKQIYQDFIY